MKRIQIKEMMKTSGIAFGTSGARGLVVQMTEQVCAAYTLAFLQNVVHSKDGGRVALGLDLRPSSPSIALACAAAIRLAGQEVIFCDSLPTPALALYAQKEGIPAIMVTGSHVPFDRNGIKFYRADGEISKGDENAIANATVSLPDSLPPSILPDVKTDAIRSYEDRYLRFFPAGCLQGMRLGLYEHSSVSRDVLRFLMEKLGAEVIGLGRTDTFVPIDTEAVSVEDQQKGREWAEKYKLNAIISTDGDGDRPLVSDEKGAWLRGDVLGLLCVQYLGATTVVTPVSSNTAIERCGSFHKVIRTRIGSPHVIAGMESALKEDDPIVVGFEANGGFLIGTTIERNGRSLDALPTRDAVMPVLSLLAMAKDSGVMVSSLLEKLPQRFTYSDRIQSFETEYSRNLISNLAQNPMAVKSLLGDICGEVTSQDMTDGLRLYFENSEIIHLRPSGNAPELRCYAESYEPALARRLVEQCLLRLKKHSEKEKSL